MSRKIKLNLKPGGPITQVPASWFEEVTRVCNAVYAMQGMGTVRVIMPAIPSDKDPIVIDGHTTLVAPNVS